MRKKVILYNPTAVFFDMPLALLAIASSVDKEKYDVSIVDGRLEKAPLKVVSERVKGALVLGITVLTGSPISDALEVSRLAKKINPDITVVWGGWHASLFPTETLDQETSVDVTVQGQGEKTFVEILEKLSVGANLSGVKGCTYRGSDKITKNPPRVLEDMNDLPRVNYDLIDPEKYYQKKGQRQFDYISSTGCFFRCSFCADPFVYKRSWTAIEPARMGEELEAQWKKNPFTDLNLQDETFFTYRERSLAVAEEFIKRKLNISWAATMRADQGSRLEDEDFGLLAKSGLRRLLIGVESGSQEMMDWMQKDIKLEQVYQCAERCLKHNISVIFPFIVGFPGESQENFHKSLKMAHELASMSKNFNTPIFYFKPYPGSKITMDAVKDGYQLPTSLEEWAKFDYIGSAGPWLTDENYKLVERFKFYLKAGYGRTRWYTWPIHKLARMRCEREYYGFPFEKIVIEKIISRPELS
ncbi:MAG: anaerobic magnesium-protoporphyrin IX monomethyl ester cyclase [Bacteroidia bacterium]